MRTCWRHSKLELRGLRDDLNTCPPSSHGVHSAPLIAQLLNLLTKLPGGRAGGASGGSEGVEG
eukprot:13308065-Alexandrium_andersonii.AAC.1